METNQNQTPLAPPSAQPGFMEQMEQFFKTYLHDKAPFHFPPSVKEFLVKFGPWITLVTILITIPGLLALFLVVKFLLILVNAETSGSITFYIINMILFLASLGLRAFALPGLFARKIQGWRLAYYAVLVSTLVQLLHGDIIGAILVIVISMYVLFEIKEYYK